jgi:hypothetical protein
MAERSYYWRFLIYPDSAPDNWRKILENAEVDIAVSPLHQPDEENLKVHYHGLVAFDSLKSQKQVENLITKPLNTVFPLISASARKSYEYLIHINHPDREQFLDSEGKPDWNMIEHFNGATRNSFCNAEDNDDEHLKIIMYIQDNCICEMRDLTNYCLGNEIDWLNLIRKSCTYYNTLLTSNRAYKREIKAYERRTSNE